MTRQRRYDQGMAHVHRLVRAVDRLLCQVGGRCCVGRAQAAWDDRLKADATRKHGR